VKIDFSLSSMLPFARSAIRHSSNFDAGQFMDLLFAELEKAGVDGVSRRSQYQGGPRQFDYGSLACSGELRYGAAEVFFHLLRHGFVLPVPQSFPESLESARYWKTPRGTEWANGSDPIPEDVTGYLRVLTTLVATLDPVIRQYVEEGLGSFSRQQFFSAAVMLGAAAEMEIYLLGESLYLALKDSAQQSRLRKLLDGRSLYRLLECIDGHVRACVALHRQFDGAPMHLSSLFEAIREQRNDAVRLRPSVLWQKRHTPPQFWAIIYLTNHAVPAILLAEAEHGKAQDTPTGSPILQRRANLH
jgi:hypothetical protein